MFISSNKNVFMILFNYKYFNENSLDKILKVLFLYFLFSF